VRWRACGSHARQDGAFRTGHPGSNNAEFRDLSGSPKRVPSGDSRSFPRVIQSPTESRGRDGMSARAHSGGVSREHAYPTLRVVRACHPAGLISGRKDMEASNRYSQPHGDKTGAYDIVVRASKSTTDAGGRVYLEVYISGYGRIENACVGVYPSWSIFDISNSTVSAWNGVGVPMDPLGVIVAIGNDSFYDAKGPLQISTECKTPPPASKAPISLDMCVDRKAPPGAHFIQFTFKYFNGESWDAKTSTTSITVRNFYQKNETLVWVVGGIAAFLSILTSIWPTIKWIGESLL